MTEQNTTSPSEFTISRTFDAPLEKVWRAFSEAERLHEWWGPKGFMMKTSTLDFRPGGLFHYRMTGPDGSTMWGRFKYREIVPMEKIIFVNSFSDAEGGIVPPPFHPPWPAEILNTIILEEENGKTTLTLSSNPINVTAEEVQTFNLGHESMHQGFTGTWDQLEEYLAKV